MVVLSYSAGALEKSLLPFHHTTTTTTTTIEHGFNRIGVILPRTDSHIHHISSVRLLRNPLFIPTKKNKNSFFINCCSNDSTDTFSISATTLTPPLTPTPTTTSTVPLVKKRTRYRKLYPGENQGITEEMRFVAMKLRNNNTTITKNVDENNPQDDSSNEEEEAEEEEGERETWQPSIEGFVKYLVNSKLVFETLERVVDESDDVAYTYFRKTGLERSKSLEKDIDWFRQQNVVIPEATVPGVSYAKYLVELAEKSAPVFLCHFYNIYFAHISGGQVIAKQVSEKLLEGKDLEFYRWEGDEQELLKDVRENLNKLGEHWTRDEKNKCLRETTKSFKFLGQIVRLIIL